MVQEDNGDDDDEEGEGNTNANEDSESKNDEDTDGDGDDANGEGNAVADHPLSLPTASQAAMAWDSDNVSPYADKPTNCL